MLDQERVERDPVASGDGATERLFRLFRGAGAHEPEPVRNTVDVGVDRDRRDPVAEDQDAVRRLRPYPREARELGKGTGDVSMKALENRSSAPRQDTGLRAVEPGRPDQGLEVGRTRAREELRVRVAREQPGAGDVGRLVPRPLR